jgi:hypothetical protein
MNPEAATRPGLRERIARWRRRMFGREDPNLAAARQHRSFDAMSGILGWMLGLARPEFGAVPLRGRALEIGTGQFMAHAAGLYVCGFDRVLTVDRYRQFALPLVRASQERPVLARRFLSPFVAHDDFIARWCRLAATGWEPAALASAGLEYRAPQEAAGLVAGAERFDLVFSYTVLEHVPPAELPGLLTASTALLAPGGVALHFVDLEDHRDPRTAPFAFLAPAPAWSEAQCGACGNRLRFSSWQRLLARHTGLEWRFPYAAVRHDAPLPPAIDPGLEHAGETDLRTTAFVAVAQARSGGGSAS